MFTARFKERIRELARRLVVMLHLLRISPNALTLAGLAICAASAVCVATGYLVAGGVVLLLASAFDIVDGAVARVTGKIYRYGAFLDSTTDRYAEAFTYIALLYHFVAGRADVIEPMLVIVALTGSLLVSYIRARAQSLGFVCEGGVLARPERVIIIVVGLIISALLLPMLWVLALLTNITALQRIWSVWRQSQHAAPDVAGASQ